MENHEISIITVSSYEFEEVVGRPPEDDELEQFAYYVEKGIHATVNLQEISNEAKEKFNK
jgi:hypothetical protein